MRLLTSLFWITSVLACRLPSQPDSGSDGSVCVACGGGSVDSGFVFDSGIALDGGVESDAGGVGDAGAPVVVLDGDVTLRPSCEDLCGDGGMRCSIAKFGDRFATGLADFRRCVRVLSCNTRPGATVLCTGINDTPSTLASYQCACRQADGGQGMAGP